MPLADFDRLDGIGVSPERPVYRRGAGPAVLLLSEAPGITPPVVAYAESLVKAGFTVWLPSLTGEDGRGLSAGYVLGEMARICIAREFAFLATDRGSPITERLRPLVRHIAGEAAGERIATIGLCFTAGVAMALATDRAVAATIAAEPSIPLAIGARRARALAIAPSDLAALETRAAAADWCVMGLRFTHDRSVPDARIGELQRRFGERFALFEIDNPPGNRHGFSRIAHSVLASDHKPGTPTEHARTAVVTFLDRHLRRAS